MPDQMVLRFDDLRDALDRALRATQARLGAEVVLQDDYYWHLPVEQAFDVQQEPGDLTMGQLSDDLAAVSPAEESGPHSAWHELAHLVGLLRALERLAEQERDQRRVRMGEPGPEDTSSRVSPGNPAGSRGSWHGTPMAR